MKVIFFIVFVILFVFVSFAFVISLKIAHKVDATKEGRQTVRKGRPEVAAHVCCPVAVRIIVYWSTASMCFWSLLTFFS